MLRDDGRGGARVPAAQEHEDGHLVLRRCSPHQAIALHHACLAHTQAAQWIACKQAVGWIGLQSAELLWHQHTSAAGACNTLSSLEGQSR